MTARRLMLPPLDKLDARIVQPLFPGDEPTLLIGTKYYRFTRLERRFGMTAVELAPEGQGDRYVAGHTQEGLHFCDCPAWKFGTLGTRPCRHIRGLYMLGLLTECVPPGCGKVETPTPTESEV